MSKKVITISMDETVAELLAKRRSRGRNEPDQDLVSCSAGWKGDDAEAVELFFEAHIYRDCISVSTLKRLRRQQDN